MNKLEGSNYTGMCFNALKNSDLRFCSHFYVAQIEPSFHILVFCSYIDDILHSYRLLSLEDY